MRRTLYGYYQSMIQEKYLSNLPSLYPTLPSRDELLPDNNRFLI